MPEINDLLNFYNSLSLSNEEEFHDDGHDDSGPDVHPDYHQDAHDDTP